MLERSLDYLRQKIGNFEPDTAIVLGSGLGLLSAAIENPIVIQYTDIPDFPHTTVVGHPGCFYIGQLGNHKVICLQGRFHLYEGIAPKVIAGVTDILYKLGVRQMIITNAAGSLDVNMPAGSLMLIKDHINFSGQNPLIGFQETPRFPDMSETYSREMRRKMCKVSEKTNIKLYEGVYIMVLGPNYETPSEVRLFRQFGADAVGMSTVPEAISAVYLGIKVLGISVISNLGAGLTDTVQTHEDVIITVAESIEKMGILIQKFLEEE
ncbi:MAG: purine-nucleoside phosphorylase [Alphaproteobacteria bacterium]|nr:purine-nucleoside phosphorylase [Alphaproteobacteria bacterium]